MEGPIRNAIHSLKYRGVRAAATELGGLLAQFLGDQAIPGDVIVPVPLHPRRLRERGYNQSALLARQVTKLTGLSLNQESLARTKDSPPQVQAGSREQRRDNVAGSFQCNNDMHGRAVILVDDVATTGSTLSACASALKSGGATSVWGLVLARED
jgi:ComF family protein